VVIDAGQVIRAGSPVELKTQIGGERLEVVVHDAETLDTAAAAVAVATGVEPAVNSAARRLTVPVPDGSAALFAAVRELDRAQVATADVGVRRPTLDDVFRQLTGPPAGASDRGHARLVGPC
jgi:ABC-2 type transport system ATP-binding protein